MLLLIHNSCIFFSFSRDLFIYNHITLSYLQLGDYIEKNKKHFSLQFIIVSEKSETKNIIKYLSQKCSTVDTHLIEDETSASNNKYDLILSIGGDGIFLSASKYA